MRVFLVAACLCLFVVGCCEQYPPSDYMTTVMSPHELNESPPYQKGQIVTSKVDGRRCVVVAGHPFFSDWCIVRRYSGAAK